MTDKADKEYKPNDSAFTKEIRSDLEQNLDKFKDPVVLAEMVYRLLEERENTNRLLKTVITKLEALEKRGVALEGASPMEQPMLPEVDEQIVAFINEEGKATAEDVRAKFNYKGKNAASARLNRLFEMGLLQKQQVGKKVFFFPTK
jgi:predicted HTH transcriptional regulator